MNIDDLIVGEEYYKGHKIQDFIKQDGKLQIKTQTSSARKNLKNVLKKNNICFQDLEDVEIIFSYYGSQINLTVNITPERALEIAKAKIDAKIGKDAKKIMKIKNQINNAKEQLEKELEKASTYERYLNTDVS